MKSRIQFKPMKRSQTLRIQLQERGHKVSTTMPRSPPSVPGDRSLRVLSLTPQVIADSFRLDRSLQSVLTASKGLLLGSQGRSVDANRGSSPAGELGCPAARSKQSPEEEKLRLRISEASEEREGFRKLFLDLLSAKFLQTDFGESKNRVFFDQIFGIKNDIRSKRASLLEKNTESMALKAEELERRIQSLKSDYRKLSVRISSSEAELRRLTSQNLPEIKRSLDIETDLYRSERRAVDSDHFQPLLGPTPKRETTKSGSGKPKELLSFANKDTSDTSRSARKLSMMIPNIGSAKSSIKEKRSQANALAKFGLKTPAESNEKKNGKGNLAAFIFGRKKEELVSGKK